jgi:transglutaminase-like putative cysteine protease
VFRFSTAALLSLAPVITSFLLLNAKGPLYLVIGWCLGVVLLGAFRRHFTIRWALFVLLGTGIIVLSMQVLITPLSAYLVWLRLVEAGKMRGSVSFIFTVFLGYFSSLFLLYLYSSRSARPLAAYAAFLCFTAFMITRRWFLLTGCVAAVVLLLVLPSGPRDHKNSAEGKTIAPALRIAGLSAAALIIAFAFAAVIHPRGSRFIDQVLSPGLRNTTLAVFPRFPLLYDIPGYGASISEKQIGDPPTLSESEVFQVSVAEGSPLSGTTLYLRTAVFDRFDGSSWHRPEEEDRSQNDIFITQNRAEYERLSATTFDRELTIEVKTDFYTTLPHTLNTTAVYAEKPITVSRGNRASGYVLEDPLLFEEMVRLGEIAPAARAGREESGSNGPLPEELQEKYLRRPTSLSDEIISLGESLQKQSVTETVTAIGRHLSDSYRYSLDVPGLDRNRSVLDTFLFERKEGFCVHFATAYIMLARINGIPARYATGFFVHLPGSAASGDASIPADGSVRTTTSVTGMSAHAWPEVYIPERGWTVYEATPPMRPGVYDNPDFWDRYIGRQGSSTVRQMRTIAGEQLPEIEDAEQGRPSPAVPIAAAAAVFSAAITFLSIRVVLRNKARRKALNTVGTKEGLILQRYAGALVRTAEGMGVRRPAEIGWIRWEEEVSARVGEVGPAAAVPSLQISAGCAAIRACFFGNRPPSRQELVTVRTLHRRLRKLDRSRR